MKATLAVIAAVVAVLALLYVATSPMDQSAEMTPEEIAQIEAEVLQVADIWEDGFEDMETDCENTASLMHPDHFAWFSGGSRIDRDGWLEYCTNATRNRAGYEGEWTTTEVRVWSPDAAVFVGSYQATYENVSGRITHYPTAGQVILFERTDTGWGVTHFSNFNGPSEVIQEGEG